MRRSSNGGRASRASWEAHTLCLHSHSASRLLALRLGTNWRASSPSLYSHDPGSAQPSLLTTRTKRTSIVSPPPPAPLPVAVAKLSASFSRSGTQHAATPLWNLTPFTGDAVFLFVCVCVCVCGSLSLFFLPYNQRSFHSPAVYLHCHGVQPVWITGPARPLLARCWMWFGGRLEGFSSALAT